MKDYTKLLAHLDKPRAYSGIYDHAAAAAIRELQEQIKEYNERETMDEEVIQILQKQILEKT